MLHAWSRKDKLQTHDEFVDKFKPKKTTDDCMTPPEVYDVVKRRRQRLRRRIAFSFRCNAKENRADDSLIERLSKSDDPWAEALIEYNKITDIGIDENLSSAMAYKPDVDMIVYNPAHPLFEYYDLEYAKLHELSHRIDYLAIKSLENVDFQNAIKETADELLYNETVKKEIEKMISKGGK